MRRQILRAVAIVTASALGCSGDGSGDGPTENRALVGAAVASIVELHDARFAPDSIPLVQAHWLVTKVRNARGHLEPWHRDTSSIRKAFVQELSAVLDRLEAAGTDLVDGINSANDNSLARASVSLEDGRKRLGYVFTRLDTARFRLSPNDTAVLSQRLEALTASMRARDTAELGMKNGFSAEWLSLTILQLRIGAFARHR